MASIGNGKRAALLLLAVPLGLLVGCGSKGASSSSFNLVVLPEDTNPKDLLDRALEQAIILCSVKNPPKIVTWKFAKADIDKPVAAQYQASKFPVTQECSAIQNSTDSGFLPSTAPGATASTAKK